MNTIEVPCPSGMILEGRAFETEDLKVFNDKQLSKQSVITGEAALANRLVVRVVDRGPYLFDGTKPPWGENVLYGDLFLFLVRSRAFVRGENYDYDIQCPATGCRKMIPWGLPLDKMPVQMLCDESKEMLRNNENRCSVHLTECDTTVYFQLLDGKVHKRQRRYTADFTDDIHVVYAARLVEVEGEAPSDEAFVRFVAKLSPNDFDQLEDAMEDADCGMDSAFDVQCNECETIFADDLGISPGFFIESFSRRRKRKRREKWTARKKVSHAGASSSGSTDSPETAS
ncbi:hypothetical protein LCGC14_0258740 [marine sediment metagenome]|uniref:Uncharacterized protein n=1 Tax=marine sediment metagenome TaxID=412755 RepID=A0A0F9U742_9ZZZZ